MQSQPSILAAVVLTFGALLPQPILAVPLLTARAHPASHAAKNASAKHRFQHTAPGKAGAGGAPLDLSAEEMRELSATFNTWDNSIALAKQGDAAAKGGDWKGAQAYYQQALNIWPDNSTALYGLGKCADAAGDTSSAVRYYRTATYADNSPHTKWNTQTNDVTRLMEYVLLLSKAGQTPEALAVYHRAAHLLNYRDADANGGKPYLKVLLPELDDSPNAVPYTPSRLQAVAHIAIAVEEGNFGSKDALTQAQEAVRLYPDSPVSYFYLGEQLKLRQKPGAKEAYVKAAALGDEKVGAAVLKELKAYD